MEYRVENKYFVTESDLRLIEQRLKDVLPRDAHQADEYYEIRSLYFDNLWDQCMDENDAGVDQRKKYRIRIYDQSADIIHLEIKEKESGLTKKIACDISREEAEQIMDGTLPLRIDGRKPLNLLQLQMRCSGMRPKAIIDYERTAYTCPVGNVRITFDRNIVASKYCDEFFQKEVTGYTSVLPKGFHLLEVKYDELLPDYVARQLEIGSLRQTAFSKYYLGRKALQGDFPIEF